MASMGGGYLDFNPETTIRKSLQGTGGMVNKTLQAILVEENLSKNGVKAELQQRLADRLREHARNKDAQKYARLKNMLENPAAIQVGGGLLPVAHYNNNSIPPFPPPAYSPSPWASQQNNMPGASGLRVRGPGMNFEFKSSPFYQIKEQIGEGRICDTMSQHRHTVTMNVRAASYPILSAVGSDKTGTMKVMVFCSADAHGRQDIAFPHQSEIKVNTGEVKANLRGLKNKPGTTLPVDITGEVRLSPSSYTNVVELTYALTTKKFFLAIFVVQTVPVKDLVKKLEVGKRITKELVVRDMISKAADTDIVATSTVLSLKCPLSTMRIGLPCRSVACQHIQCFDAESYLQLQMQAPTWLCPICNKAAPFESLAVDEYVKDILKSTSRSIDQVIIEPNGVWKSHEKEKPEPQAHKGPRESISFDDDDEIVEVSKPGMGKADNSLAYRTPNSVPPIPSSREQSTASSAQLKGSVSGKRTISDVIDLTSSGDEDDEPLARQPKRQFTGFGVPSANVPYRGNFGAI
ncbi:MIZ/SP-RING zinc finger [Phlyctema vagabunda]|uniref:MIZ/SP-RING zinc finger n=1 Tax=Phlyctema vagabunda TaxID=108571 RepID=A0ABR4PQQ8_9HELO